MFYTCRILLYGTRLVVIFPLQYIYTSMHIFINICLDTHHTCIHPETQINSCLCIQFIRLRSMKGNSIPLILLVLSPKTAMSLPNGLSTKMQLYRVSHLPSRAAALLSSSAVARKFCLPPPLPHSADQNDVFRSSLHQGGAAKQSTQGDFFPPHSVCKDCVSAGPFQDSLYEFSIVEGDSQNCVCNHP